MQSEGDYFIVSYGYIQNKVKLSKTELKRVNYGKESE